MPSHVHKMAYNEDEGCSHHRIPLAVAKRKCEEQNSSFVRVETVEHINIEPVFLGQVQEGIRQQLDKKLMRYSEELNGIIVAYDKLEFKHKTGRIVGEQPFIHFDIKVEYIVFKPTINCCLTGVINKFGGDHVGLLVHKRFNASLPLSSNAWDKFQNAEIGTKVLFRVTGIEAVSDVLLITGAVDNDNEKTSKSSHSKAESRENEFVKQESSSPVKKKRKRKKHEEDLSKETEANVSMKYKTYDRKRTNNHIVEDNNFSDSSSDFKVKKEKYSDSEINNKLRKSHKEKKKKKSFSVE